ncbi:MAG: aldehyde ferredoxin oxidoreductase C-terminal domain-containing protein, partial [Spirochaetota bacterium]
GVTLSLNELGMLPTRNFRYGYFEGAEEISGEKLKETILVGQGTCRACFIRCKREGKVVEPYQVDPRYGGPEYETIAALGSLLEIGDLKAISRANQLCGMYGMDTISLGTTLAFAMECYEDGILTKKDTGGIDLRFGSAEALLEIIEMVAKREGIGDLLAEGVKRAAERIGKGSDRYALHVKGQPLPMHEPRAKQGLALAYAVSPTGADHLEHPHDPCFETDELMKNVHPLGLLDRVPSLDLSEKKVRLFIYLQHYYNLVNSIGMCLLTLQPYTDAFTITHLVDITRATTGWDTSLWEMLKVGERFSNMARIFNLREGITSADDILPERLFEPLEGGILKGEALDREEFFEARRKYYGMMGWNPDTGIPSSYKLMELDLDWLLNDLKVIESSVSSKSLK